MNLKSSLFISLRYYYVRFLEKQILIIEIIKKGITQRGVIPFL